MNVLQYEVSAWWLMQISSLKPKQRYASLTHSHTYAKGVPGAVSDNDSDINNVFCCMLAIQSHANVSPWWPDMWSWFYVVWCLQISCAIKQKQIWCTTELLPSITCSTSCKQSEPIYLSSMYQTFSVLRFW
jgi:hypothetical protein